MSFAAFDLHDQVAFAAVVFARNRNDAQRLGHEHVASFIGSTTSNMTVLERLPPLGGAARDHHLAAVRAGIAGIGHRQADGSWLVLPPGSHPPQVERTCPMRMFHFTDDEGYEVVLFARNQERAGELYAAILSDYGALPQEWRGSEWEAWSVFGMVRHQAPAENRGTEGVGIYNPYGWLILPLDYDVLGVAPPD